MPIARACLHPFPATPRGGKVSTQVVVDPTCVQRFEREIESDLEHGHRESALSRLGSVIDVCRPEPKHVEQALVASPTRSSSTRASTARSRRRSPRAAPSRCRDYCVRSQSLRVSFAFV
jgi:hypothetical protein